ncbi:hypothetical protein SASPL_143677 [Salvia splendens]|uniref:Uncharacterized protein n=1 Tax=Salvia splendens TaxID=180675 RepID=A0A8X8WP45_SALSN|nr:hypothetical protein SASPL_143677 [Salvia splendens]
MIPVLPLAAVAAMLLCALRIEESVHQYTGQRFAAKGNAYVILGGSEGLHSSSPGLNDSFPDHSFIRGLWTSPISAQNLFMPLYLRSTTGSAYGVQRAICCSADLAKLGVCKQGQIIYGPATNNPGWPQVFGVSFDVDATNASLEPSSLQITKTGMSFIVIHGLRGLCQGEFGLKKSYWLATW